MYPSVSSQFRKFNETFENSIAYMYLDIKGLVTIGVGNLIDPVEEALGLPFRYKNNGQPASQNDIRGEWNLLKNRPELAQQGCKACAPLTRLELDDAAIEHLIASRLQKNEDFLKRQKAFSKYDAWPADAQLGLLSMAWAMGPGFGVDYPKFCSACASLDFATAAAQCQMEEEGNPGVIPRNKANRLLFMNAAAVVRSPASTYQKDKLYYPASVKTAPTA